MTEYQPAADTPRCPSCGAALRLAATAPYGGDVLWVCLQGHAITEEQRQAASPPPAPNCPTCGAAMDYHAAVMPLPAYYRCERHQISMPILYDVWPKFGEVVEPPARVPCPACDGEAMLRMICVLCRTRGDVPPALAEAWTADGDSGRSGGEG